MRYPLWKYILIVIVLVVSAIYSLPNLYPDEPAIQISGANAGVKADKTVLSQAETALKQAGLTFHGSEVQAKGVLLRVNTSDEQLKAQEIVRRALGDGYVVALNLAPTTPEWLLSLNAAPMKLGLDLRGGVHFLLEVDMSKVLEQRQETYATDIKAKFREAKVAYRTVADITNGLTVKFAKEEDRTAAKELLAREYREFVLVPAMRDNELYLDLAFAPEKLKEFSDYAIEQNLTTLRNRVNELGVAEAVVQRQGSNRIVVQLPGVQDTAEAKRVLGRTATLEFRFVDWEHQGAVDGIAPAGTEIFPMNKTKEPVLLQRKKIVTGDRVVNAQSGFDEYSNPQVNITLDGRGGKMMADATRDNVGKQMAVLFVEHKQRIKFTTDANGQTVEIREPYVEKNVINRATVQSMLGSQFRITGLDSPEEGKELALLLRAGALAAPMYFVEERTIGPSLGQDNIDKGLLSTQVGFAAVALFMLVFYRVFGIVANIALFMNVAMMIAIMSAIGAALSLPGIAGIVLTVGMAVDANVLIFERIREELRAGQSPQSAIIAGYDRAYTTILDANITTLIVAFILFAVGTGPVKGFAVTLSIGIMCSMFTAITVTRAVVQIIYGNRRVAKLSI
ncbi:MAG TPA: protein translocase subunit SecD [Agitococcus sp.]|nr:protein translocase subunit SecD [Agitococcus sp.]HMX99161.1 protein translocase subunit SecD [Agitococcus sp.]HNB19701.1 protein translocase subunit SecD [Agitococcus sp.]HNG10245.1 protein translocase subunit SecD [Agitococcus sp.]HNI62085.1 protein translocase subunit SecD [Agitococcus sp.]